MKQLLILFPIVGTLLSTALATEQTFQLARELLAEQSHELSAVEFRRFAFETENPKEQAAAYLFAGYAYLQDNDGRSSSEMIDRAEEADHASSFLNERTLLSAESARMIRDPDTALYFYDLLSTGGSNTSFQTFARRRAAAIHFSSGNLDAARMELGSSPADETLAFQALDAFARGSDKSPLVGGLWGLVPGAGYWYSGEIANGFRSLILNSLFIYGMAQTAQEDQWGAFAAITFFEVTWYSGSIYGGIDAAQRHNKERIDATLHEIEGDLSFQPKPEIIVPVFKLNIHF